MEVYPDLGEFDDAVRGELALYGDHGHEAAGPNVRAVLGTPGDQLGEILPAGAELLDGLQHLVGEEVGGRRLTVRSALVAELGRRGGRRSPGWCGRSAECSRCVVLLLLSGQLRSQTATHVVDARLILGGDL